MTDKSNMLIDLAKSRYSQLTNTEMVMLKIAYSGDYEPEPKQVQIKDIEDSFDTENLRKIWGDDYIIRAELLCWLCKDSQAKSLVHYNGLHVDNALILDKFSTTLNLADLDLTFPLMFKNSVFQSNLYAARANLRRVYFEKCSFQLGVDFDNANIIGDFIFDNCNSRSLNLENSIIGRDLYVRGGELGELWAPGATVKNDVVVIGKDCKSKAWSIHLNRANMMGDTVFRGLAGVGDVKLCDSKFSAGLTIDDIVCFESSKLTPCIDLRGVTVTGTLMLSALRGVANINARNIKISEDFRIHDVEFLPGGGLFAEKMEVNGTFIWEPDISSAKSNRGFPTLSLKDARVGTITDAPRYWPEKGHLELDGFIYNEINQFTSTPGQTYDYEAINVEGRLEWLQRQSTSSFYYQPYEQLARYFRKKGRNRDAISVLIAGEDQRRAIYNSGNISRYWATILRLTTGHGYLPSRSIWYILTVVALGSVIFCWGYEQGVLVTEGKSNPPTKFNCIVYSLDTFIPVVNFRQSKYWVPNGKSGLGLFLQIYMWFHIALGWALSSLAVAAYSGLTRKRPV